MAEEQEARLILRSLARRGIEIEDGLSEARLETVESRWSITIPEELRSILRLGFPRGKDFPDWREAEAQLGEWIDRPIQEVLFGVETNGFWAPSWGPRPTRTEEARRICGERLRAAPPLVPVYRHRFLVCDQTLKRRPVLSVHQTDIIVYGATLREFFRKEFQIQAAQTEQDSDDEEGSLRVSCWSELIELNDAAC